MNQPALTAADMRKAMKALTVAFRPVIVRQAEMIRQMHTALKPLIDHAHQHPEVLEQWRRQREAETQLGSCHCLCGIHRHQADGVCTGYAEPGLTMRFTSPTVGPTDVPMCGPCHRANTARQGLPAVGTPTDTCTCHCWANHPGQAGVCEAASDPGTHIDGQPACLACEESTKEAAP